MQPALQIHHLSVFYGDHQALKETSLDLNFGEVLAIVGPNGGGKSTLLKAVIGLVPYQGKITSRFSSLLYLPQRSDIEATFPISLRDVVASGCYARIGALRPMTSDLWHLVDQSMEEVGLKGLEDRTLDRLSGGQFQRTLFARLKVQVALAKAPILVLLDEPFAGIDAQTTADLMDQVLALHKAGATIVAVLHDLSLVKEAFPRTAVIQGTLVAYGPTQEVLPAFPHASCSHPLIEEGK